MTKETTKIIELGLLDKHEGDECIKCPNGLSGQGSPDNTYGTRFQYRNLGHENLTVHPMDNSDVPYPTEFLIVTCRCCGWVSWRPCDDIANDSENTVSP